MVIDLSNGRLLSREAEDLKWRELSDTALIAVAREYGVDYAVFETSRVTKLPVSIRSALQDRGLPQPGIAGS